MSGQTGCMNGRPQHIPDDYALPADDDALLGECVVQTFRATGPGGQGVNTTDSAVRLKHVPTGITVVCRRERSQYLNKQSCLRRLRERISEAQRPVVPRRPTKRSRGSQEARLTAKRINASHKVNRRKPTQDE